MARRFPAPWTVEQIPEGFKVLDATGLALAYVYAIENEANAHSRQGADHNQTRRIMRTFQKLPNLLTPPGS